MKIEKIEVMNVENALRGMRNPMNSWSKSDSIVDNFGNVIVGPKDKELARKLIKSGSEHRKYMRQIFVSMDITAPIYWWKEFDTYKVGTVSNSTSTMHKILSKPIEMADFEMDDFHNMPVYYDLQLQTYWYEVIEMLERIRLKSVEWRKGGGFQNPDPYWKELIRLLPESYLQTRTVTTSFENLLNICRQRKGHKLTEWHIFIDRMRTIPHAEDFLFFE